MGPTHLPLKVSQLLSQFEKVKWEHDKSSQVPKVSNFSKLLQKTRFSQKQQKLKFHQFNPLDLDNRQL